MPIEYTPKRIERAINGYTKDIERIMDATDKNGKEMADLIARRQDDLIRINQLKAHNQEMRDEWKTIDGKIQMLQEIAGKS